MYNCTTYSFATSIIFHASLMKDLVHRLVHTVFSINRAAIEAVLHQELGGSMFDILPFDNARGRGQEHLDVCGVA